MKWGPRRSDVVYGAAFAVCAVTGFQIGTSLVGVADVEAQSPPDLCAGLAPAAYDKLRHPASTIPQPTVGQGFIDPEFGGRVVRITAVDPAEGEDAVIKPVYSTVQSWNADESRFLLWHRRGQEYRLYDGTTYAFVRSVPLESPTDLEHVLWDPLDPDVLYYPSNYNAQPRLMRYRVSTNTSEVVRNFGTAPTSCATSWSTLLTLGGDPMHMSWGAEKRVGLSCGAKHFVYSIATDTVVGGPVTNSGLDTFAVDPSGTLAYSSGKVYAVDAGMTFLRSLPVEVGEHGSIGVTASGDPFLAAVAFDGPPNGTLIAYSLIGKPLRSIIGGDNPASGWPYPQHDTHVSALALKSPGWVAVSTTGYDAGSGRTPGTNVLDNEILLANVDSGRVCRVAHVRSKGDEGAFGYFGEPHAAISPSGTRILFASDWNGGKTVDTYVVELPSYRAASPSPSPTPTPSPSATPTPSPSPAPSPSPSPTGMRCTATSPKTTLYKRDGSVCAQPCPFAEVARVHTDRGTVDCR